MKMKIGFGICALLMAVGGSDVMAFAQAQPVPPATSPAETAAPTTNAATPAAAATPASAPEPAKPAAPAKPHLSRCALAIRAAERKLDKSTASPDKVASAWHHIEEAKNSKGQVCQAHASEAADLL